MTAILDHLDIPAWAEHHIPDYSFQPESKVIVEDEDIDHAQVLLWPGTAPERKPSLPKRMPTAMTHREIGTVLGISEFAVRQIEKKALAKARRLLAGRI